MPSPAPERPLLWLVPLIGHGGAPGPRRAVRAGLLGGPACCAGLLAAPAGLHSVRALHDARATAQADVAWVVIVVTAATVVTAAAVAVTDRSGHPMPTALIAAGVTALAGIAVQYVKASADGCLGPLNTLTTGCSVRPGRALTALQNPIGHLLGPALLLSALAAALGSIRWTSARARGAGHAVAGAAHPPRSGPRRAAVVVAVAAAALVGADTVHAAVAGRTPIPDEKLVLAYAAPPPASPATQRTQFKNWWILGGEEVVAAYESTGRSFVAALDTLLKAKDDGAIPVFQASVRPSCDRFSALVRRADEYFPVPIAAGRPLWTRLITAYRRTAAGCHALERTNGADLGEGVVASGGDVDEAASAIGAFSGWSVRFLGK